MASPLLRCHGIMGCLSYNGERATRSSLETAVTARTATWPPPRHAPLPEAGTVLHARLHVQGELGRGGSAVVLGAYDVWAARPVALKFPNVLDVLDAELLAQREARALSAVVNPALPTLYAVDHTEAGAYLELERLSTFHLADCLGELPLPAPAALDMLASLADGLDALHRAGFAHRDVKAENVLFRGAQAVLADHGLAIGADDPPDECRRSVGTPMYLAPEVARDEVNSLDDWQAADRYSFAVTAFYTLTGRLPFEAKTTASVLWQHLTRPPPRASEVQRTLPEEVDAVFDRALAKSAGARPRSATVLVEGLRAACA